MSAIWPKETPRYTGPSAEQKAYDALKVGLPDGWQAWHSLRLRSRESGQFGEGDFLIADPSGPAVLILEVKGGKIQCMDGRWFQNGHAMESSPLDQALSFRKLLIERLKDLHVHLPTTGCAVCFPDVVFEEGPIGDDLRGLVIGEQELPYLKDILPVVMNRAVPDPWPVSSGWLHAIHKLWGETWTPSISLGGKVDLDAGKRLRLDEAQARVLECLDGNERLFITGSAGTGKTVLAARAAVLEAEKGRKFLLLCYTEALAAFLNAYLNDDRLTVGAIRQFASNLLGERGPEGHTGHPVVYWDSVSLRAAVDGVPPKEDRWETVIVDEGQDFSGDDWELVKECVHPKGKLWVFADPSQGFWDDRGVKDDLMNGFMKFNLKTPYRCPRPIQHLDECYSGACHPERQILKQALKDRVIHIITSSEGRLKKQIGKEINRLLSEKLKPHDIAILSLRGLGSEEGIFHEKQLADHPLVPATDPNAADHIICDTFLRFKGLERPAIIITDLRLVKKRHHMRMHIAVSRALSLLRIVGVEQEIKKDRVLSELL